MADMDTAGELTGAQSLVKSLEQVGADTVFGIPGGAILPAYDPLYDSEHVRHILVRHEQGAGHAAQGYAMVTGKVGVCMATSGPGATNLVTPIADAYMDSVPMVAITGQVASAAIGTDAFQEADIRGITMPITKHNFLVTKAADIPAAIASAFHIAGTGRPGPVLVDVTKDALQGRSGFTWPTHLDLPGYRPVTKPHGKQVREAARLIVAVQATGALRGRRCAQGQCVQGAARARRPDRHPGGDHPDGARLLQARALGAAQRAVAAIEVDLGVDRHPARTALAPDADDDGPLGAQELQHGCRLRREHRGRMTRDLGERDGLLPAPRSQVQQRGQQARLGLRRNLRAVGLTMPAVFQRGPPEATPACIPTCRISSHGAGYAIRMDGKFSRITLRADELVGYRAAVIACSLAEERELCERLLGQIASLESQAVHGAPDAELTFAPPPGGARARAASVGAPARAAAAAPLQARARHLDRAPAHPQLRRAAPGRRALRWRTQGNSVSRRGGRQRPPRAAREVRRSR